MKRVIAACLRQTLHFQIKEDLPREEAARLVRTEVEHYKAGLARKGGRYRIDSEDEQPDGSVILKVRKQNLNTPVGEYLD
ncbi:MAG: hypothetical protein IKD53_11255 [Clostridia bacterium]|nr:hypothetical protein [Clostridia bacterium]